MRNKLFVGVACAAALTLAVGMPATAATADDDLTTLVTLNPGASESDLDASVREYASAAGITYEEALSAAVADGTASRDAAGTSTGSAARSSASGGEADKTLGSANNKGDVFVSPSWTGIVEHGHTGIYYTTATIVEAPGTGQDSRSVSANDKKVAAGAVKQSVGISQTSRNASANYAYDNLRGKGYNVNFAVNKDENGSEMNCSQLVWAAFKHGAGIDIDGNGGPGVYPYNIKDSDYTETYATL